LREIYEKEQGEFCYEKNYAQIFYRFSMCSHGAIGDEHAAAGSKPDELF
jgi:hypothetical protein